MEKKFIIIVLLGLILAISVVSAVFYPEPWGNDVDAGNYNLNNVNNITANNFIGAVVGSVDSLNWTKLQNYPVACPGSGAITQLDDSVTCSDLWFNLAGNETISGNMTFSGAEILNASSIESLDWTNVTITTGQISDYTEANLNVNSSDYWDDMGSINATQLEDDGGVLHILDSWITAGWCALTGCTISGDVNITGNLNVTGNITGLDVFTRTHCNSYSSNMQTITNVSTYKIITFETNVGCDKITQDTQNFTLPDAGVYSVFVDLQADKTGGATSTVEAILLLDGVPVNGTARQRTINSNNEVGYFAIDADLEVTAGQVLNVGITASTSLGQLDMVCVLCERNVTAAISIDRIS